MANLPSYMKLVALIFFKVCTAEENCTLQRNNAGRNTGQEGPNLSQLYPYYVSGYDYENVPVLVIEAGRWDHLYVSEHMDRYEEELKVFEAGYFGCYEKLSNTTIISDDSDEILVGQFALILDFEYFSIKQLSTSESARLMLNFWKGSKRFDNNVAYGFYINMNAAAENLALLSKPLMSKAFGRSELYGTRRQSWLPALLRKIPKSDLPSWYGGDKACSKVTLGCL